MKAQISIKLVQDVRAFITAQGNARSNIGKHTNLDADHVGLRIVGILNWDGCA